MEAPTRRQVLFGVGAAVVGACSAPQAGVAASSPSRPPPHGPGSLPEIEARLGARLGVFAIDVGSERQVEHRADERFAMCSTFKWVLAAAVLARADRGEVVLSDRVPYGAGDLLEHAPVARARLREGSLPIDALAEAAVVVSDNTAANLLLSKVVDGPAGVTAFARAQGDVATRLDRDEPSLNENRLDDPRDTTTPRAMAGLMRRVLCGEALAPASRERLLGWLRACATGADRLRAGFPAGWTVGDKTGTGERGAVNDVALAAPPGRSPIVVAAYVSDGAASHTARLAALSDVAKVVAQRLGRS